MKHLFSPSPIEMFPEPGLGIVEVTLAPHQSGRVKRKSIFIVINTTLLFAVFFLNLLAKPYYR